MASTTEKAFKLAHHEEELLPIIYLPNGDIANLKGIKRRTADKYVELILQKTNCRSKAELILKLSLKGFEFDLQFLSPDLV